MSDQDTQSIQRPSLALLGTEPFRAAIEFAWHKLGQSDDAKPGDGHPVVIFPGLQPSRDGLEPGSACGGRGPAGATARAMAALRARAMTLPPDAPTNDFED